MKEVRQLAAHLRGEFSIEPEPVWQPEETEERLPDFSDVMGQEHVKRALEVAAAGAHNVLLVGPPGSRQEHAGRRLPSILPDVTREEALEVTQIHSVMGLLTPESPLVRRRPFRSPHHTISAPGLTGGGSTPRRVRSHWPTAACCSSMSCRNSDARRWRSCASRLRTAW